MSSAPNWLEFFEDRERLYANYYLDFAHQHARRDPAAYEQLEAESGNLFKTAAWLAEQNEAEGVLRLATALWEQSDFMRSRGFIQRGLPLLEQARQAARQLADLRAEFTCLEALAYVHYSIGDHALAQPLYEQALVLAQDMDEPQFRAKAQVGKGRLLIDMGHLDQAAILLKRSLDDYRQIQDYGGEIETLIALGNLLSLQGEFATAEDYIKQGILLAQARLDRYSEAELRYVLGYAANLAQDWPKAIIHFEAATALARAIGDRYFEVRGLTALGEAWLVQGNVQQAVTLLEEALARQDTSDDVLTKAFTHLYLAKAYHGLNKTQESLAQLKEVYPLRKLPVLANLAADAAWLRANNYLKQGQTDLARTALHDFLNLAPDHMIEIRQAAESLLEAIDSGAYGSELVMTI
jgi:tetratricopeptide (TPR) repeat protein